MIYKGSTLFSKQEVIDIIHKILKEVSEIATIECSEAFDPSCDKTWFVVTKENKTAKFSINKQSITNYIKIEKYLLKDEQS